MQIQKVKFKSHFGPYNPGECAGFSHAKAKALCDLGVAEMVYLAPAPSPAQALKEIVKEEIAPALVPAISEESEEAEPKRRKAPKKLDFSGLVKK